MKKVWHITSDSYLSAVEELDMEPLELMGKMMLAEASDAQLFVFRDEDGKFSQKLVKNERIESDDFNMIEFVRTGKL